MLIAYGPATEDLGLQTEQVAYMSVEEGRLHCEQLLGVEPGNSHLRRVHREVGLAGYKLSDRLDCDTRHRRLALAYPSRDEQREAAQPLESLGPCLVEATGVVDRALAASGLAEHLRQARVHVLRACVAHDGYLGSTPASE